MPNGESSVTDWLIHLDGKLTAIDNKLDTKASTISVERIEDRVQGVEDKTSRLAVKQAGIAGAAAMVGIWLKSTFFGD